MDLCMMSRIDVFAAMELFFAYFSNTSFIQSEKERERAGDREKHTLSSLLSSVCIHKIIPREQVGQCKWICVVRPKSTFWPRSNFS